MSTKEILLFVVISPMALGVYIMFLGLVLHTIRAMYKVWRSDK